MAMKSDVVEELRIAPEDFERVRHLRPPSLRIQGISGTYCGGPQANDGRDGTFEFPEPDLCVVCVDMAMHDLRCEWYWTFGPGSA